jgi:lipoyl(octanoyl) transferase
MKWVLINSGSNTGKFNMEYDLRLAKEYSDDEIILRLYRWKPYCISLGANQSPDSINADMICRDNIDMVKRPTGGRAVLHSEELTYSVVYPLDFSSSARDIYRQLNLALLKGLQIYDTRLSVLELENHQPNFAEIYKNENNAACFAVSAKSEIKFSGKKIVGSAQRKFEKVVLQHGSILCGPYHKQITRYLNLCDEGKKEIEKEIEANTIDLGTILNEKIEYDRLVFSISKGFEEHYDMTFFNVPASNDLILITN